MVGGEIAKRKRSKGGKLTQARKAARKVVRQAKAIARRFRGKKPHSAAKSTKKKAPKVARSRKPQAAKPRPSPKSKTRSTPKSPVRGRSVPKTKKPATPVQQGIYPLPGESTGLDLDAAKPSGSTVLLSPEQAALAQPSASEVASPSTEEPRPDSEIQQVAIPVPRLEENEIGPATPILETAPFSRVSNSAALDVRTRPHRHFVVGQEPVKPARTIRLPTDEDAHFVEVEVSDHLQMAICIQAWNQAITYNAPLAPIQVRGTTSRSFILYSPVQSRTAPSDLRQRAILWLEFWFHLLRLPPSLYATPLRVWPTLASNRGLPQLILRPNANGVPLSSIPDILHCTLEFLSGQRVSRFPGGSVDEAKAWYQQQAVQILQPAPISLPPQFGLKAGPDVVELCSSREGLALSIGGDSNPLGLHYGKKQNNVRVERRTTDWTATGVTHPCLVANHNVGEECLGLWTRLLFHLHNGMAGDLALNLLGAAITEEIFAETNKAHVVATGKKDGKTGARIFRVDEIDHAGPIQDTRLLKASGLVKVLDDQGTNLVPFSTSRHGRDDRDEWATVVGLDPDNANQLLIQATDLLSSGWLLPDNASDRLLARRYTAVQICARSPWISGIFDDSSEATGLELVHGPPGTGKTYTACQRVMDLLQAHPNARVLLSAKEHLVLENLHTKLVEQTERAKFPGKILRLGVDPKSKYEPLRRQLPLPDWLVALADELKSTYPPDEKADIDWEVQLGIEEAQIVVLPANDYRIIHLLASRGMPGFDLVIVEEAGKMTLMELAPLLSLAPRQVLIGDDMQLPTFGVEELERIARELAFVQTTHTEGRLFEALSLADKMGLSEHLLPPELVAQPFHWLVQHKSQTKALTRLRDQYRMPRALSDMVASTFYETTFADHHPGMLHEHLPRLRWIDVPHASLDASWREQQTSSGTTQNEREARLLISLAEELVSQGIATKDITILTFYTGQEDNIRRKKSVALAEVEVRTVDSYQGRQNHFILLGLTRNNNLPVTRQRWGFMTDERRLNVALSRAHQALWIVGSARHVEDTTFTGTKHLATILAHFKRLGAVSQIRSD